MTTVQVLVSIVFVIGAQLVPQIMIRLDGRTLSRVDSWWFVFLPPVWFAGIDDAVVGSGARSSWLMGSIGIAATSTVLWFAFRRLATSYHAGLQAVADSTSRRPVRARSSVLQKLVRVPPLSWWLRDSVSRGSFVLSAAYLFRDRDTKTRLYPGIAPMLVMPIIMMMPGRHSSSHSGSFGAAFAGSYLGLVPMLALGMLELSQQWQASDIFRLAPVSGPAEFANGARRAVLLLITLPMLLLFAALVVVMGNASQLRLMVPGVMAIPIYAMVPCLGGRSVPLSRPTDEAKAATRGFRMIGVMIFSGLLAAAATFADSHHLLNYLISGEFILVVTAYLLMRVSASRAPWPALD
jgi:hypothetical protein